MAELTPEERQRIYAEEKARHEIRKELEAKDKPKVIVTKPKTSLVTLGCMWLIVAAVVIGVIGNIASSCSENKSQAQSTAYAVNLISYQTIATSSSNGKAVKYILVDENSTKVQVMALAKAIKKNGASDFRVGKFDAVLQLEA